MRGRFPSMLETHHKEKRMTITHHERDIIKKATRAELETFVAEVCNRLGKATDAANGIEQLKEGLIMTSKTEQRRDWTVELNQRRDRAGRLQKHQRYPADVRAAANMVRQVLLDRKEHHYVPGAAQKAIRAFDRAARAAQGK